MEKEKYYETPCAERVIVNAANILGTSLINPDEEEEGGSDVIVTPPDEF